MVADGRSHLDRTNPQTGDGTLCYPSGNVAVVICSAAPGFNYCFFTDGSSTILATFDVRGIGGVSFRNGKPWLVVGEKSYTISSPAGNIVERGVVRQEPLT
jgi:hypothetical protein